METTIEPTDNEVKEIETWIETEFEKLADEITLKFNGSHEIYALHNLMQDAIIYFIVTLMTYHKMLDENDPRFKIVKEMLHEDVNYLIERCSGAAKEVREERAHNYLAAIKESHLA